MSQAFLCECGRRTTDPYIVDGRKMCVICAEDEAPEVVDRRERKNSRKFQDHKVPMKKWGSPQW